MELQEGESAPRSSDSYPSYEMMYRFEQDARRKDVEMKRLWELSQNDPTINTFLKAWQAGHFQSFEQMLVKLSVQLAMEKAEYIKTATKAIQTEGLSSESKQIGEAFTDSQGNTVRSVGSPMIKIVSDEADNGDVLLKSVKEEQEFQ